MGAVQWVGIGFLAVLVIFFMVAYFHKGDGGNQYTILRVLSALSGGMAGLFLTGSIIAQITGKSPEGYGLDVNATGALGMMFLIWVTFPKSEATTEQIEPVEPAFSTSFPRGTQFYQAALVLGQSQTKTVELRGFTDAQKAAPLLVTDITAATVEAALADLGKLVSPGTVPPYSVEKETFGFVLSA